MINTLSIIFLLLFNMPLSPIPFLTIPPGILFAFRCFRHITTCPPHISYSVKNPRNSHSGDFSYVRERIRTPDTLVRSQVLYPAELRTHILFSGGFALPRLPPSYGSRALLPPRTMPATGIEPVLYFYNRILSPARLPVPPRRPVFPF